MIRLLRRLAPVFALLVMLSSPAMAADWSTTELHYNYGRLKAPSFAGGAESGTHILTFQHASGWKYGDTFFFIDHLDDGTTDGFNDRDFYGELYLNFSVGKLRGEPVGFGPVSDIGLLIGLNAAADANVRKWLPGVRLSWKIPGFAFLNIDFTAYIDDSAGAASGGAPTEDTSFMIDVNFKLPFSAGGQDFSIEGHAEYIGERENEFGGTVEAWIFIQPQFRWDMGKALFSDPGRLFAGIEWQYWSAKLGDKDTGENVIQALLVWKL